jgi:hypothetical protein
MKEQEPRPARCRTCKRLHPVEMKQRAREQGQGEPLGYGTHTLPKKFWTKTRGN